MPNEFENDATAAPGPLSAAQLHQFVTDGFVRLDEAFPRALAEEARAILWRDTGCDPQDPRTWVHPVVRLLMYTQPCFVAAANTPALHGAFDQLVGAERWLPCQSVGTFPVRFPSAEAPNDTGWHIDVSFDYEQLDFFAWRANIYSRGRSLLLLFLFSDVGEDDAPTLIRVGSHRPMARLLAGAGDAGLTLRELSAADYGKTSGLPEARATGAAGTVYLCHPFLVHSAQAHRGSRPRFLAQPPLLPRDSLRPFDPLRPLAAEETSAAVSPVEAAIRLALVETA